jgi:hypothetical protein
MLTNMSKQNRVFIKDVNFLTGFIGSRNVSCRDTSLKITMNRNVE